MLWADVGADAGALVKANSLLAAAETGREGRWIIHWLGLVNCIFFFFFIILKVIDNTIFMNGGGMRFLCLFFF